MSTAVLEYEKQLNRDPIWALQEGSMHFDSNNAVFRSLNKITSRLDELEVPYALAGGMALFQHGYRRFTDDVDLLVTKEGLAIIQDRLVGLGYIPPFAGSKNLRDAENGVRIEFLITGDYPGDGKPKAIAFPNPEDSYEMIGSLRCLKLAKLVELKLASGQAAWRLKDLGDVQELIRTLSLPVDLAEQLHPDVQSSYQQLWSAVQQGQ